MLPSSRAARLLKKDPRDLHLGAIVKRLYLSGPVGGAGLRELLAHDESMDTDQPELDSGVASGGATPSTFGTGCARCRGLKSRPGRAREGLRVYCACNRARIVCPEPGGALNLWAGRGAEIPFNPPPHHHQPLPGG